MQFEYFRGPDSDMAHLLGNQACSLCGSAGPVFALDSAICPELTAEASSSAVGCVRCLQEGRFQFWHDTEVGLLDETGLQHVYNHNLPPPPGFHEEALGALRRTPQIASWQQELWLTHCLDFMAYLGTWDPPTFYANAPDGDGRALFLRMTDEYQGIWDQSVPPGQGRLSAWHITYYAFRCRHCGVLRGNWDVD